MGQGIIMADSFLLDTDVLIDFLRGYDKAVDFVTANANSHRIICHLSLLLSCMLV